MFERCSEIKYQENPSGGNWVLPCGQVEGTMDGRTDVTKLLTILLKHLQVRGPVSSAGIATDLGLDGPGIEFE